jgi:hypothetical protein
MSPLLLRLLPIVPFVIQLITVDICPHGHLCVVFGMGAHCAKPSDQKKGTPAGERVVDGTDVTKVRPPIVIASTAPAPARFQRTAHRYASDQATFDAVFRPPIATWIQWLV